MSFQLEHSGINVTDLERSLTFYREALGLTERFRFSPPDNPQVVLSFLGDGKSGQLLELSCLGALKQGAYDKGENPFHLGVIAEDIEAAHALHEGMGIICADDPNAEVYFIEDPDGYRIEIIPAVRTQRPF